MEQGSEAKEGSLKTIEKYSPDIPTASVCGHCARSLYFKENISFVDADNAAQLKLCDNSFPLYDGENLTSTSIKILSKVRYAKYVRDSNRKEIFCNHCGSTYNNCIIQRVLGINLLVFV